MDLPGKGKRNRCYEWIKAVGRRRGLQHEDWDRSGQEDGIRVGGGRIARTEENLHGRIET